MSDNQNDAHDAHDEHEHEHEHDADEPFVVARDEEAQGETPMVGGTRLDPAVARHMLRRRIANPDDPVVRRPRHGPAGPVPGPMEQGSPGRVAIVQGQVYLVAVIVIVQLFLVTVSLNELLSGRTAPLWGIAAISFCGFVITLIVHFWPRRIVKGY